PATRISPFIHRVLIFLSASAPPTAATYFAMISSGCTCGPRPPVVGVAAPRAGGSIPWPAVDPGRSASSTGGIATGRSEPRWHVLQVTCVRPPKLALLISSVIVIIDRAVFLAPLSSASGLPSTWHVEHSTPSDAEMNCIAGTN